jgi:hypothetical protein
MELIGPEQIGSWYLEQGDPLSLRQGKERRSGNFGFSLCFTVPVDSFEAYRLWIPGQVCGKPLESSAIAGWAAAPEI